MLICPRFPIIFVLVSSCQSGIHVKKKAEKLKVIDTTHKFKSPLKHDTPNDCFIV